MWTQKPDAASRDLGHVSSCPHRSVLYCQWRLYICTVEGDRYSLLQSSGCWPSMQLCQHYTVALHDPATPVHAPQESKGQASDRSLDSWRPTAASRADLKPRVAAVSLVSGPASVLYVYQYGHYSPLRVYHRQLQRCRQYFEGGLNGDTVSYPSR